MTDPVTDLKQRVLDAAIEAGGAYEAYSESYDRKHVSGKPLKGKVLIACTASIEAELRLRELSRQLYRALNAESAAGAAK